MKTFSKRFEAEQKKIDKCNLEILKFIKEKNIQIITEQKVN